MKIIIVILLLVSLARIRSEETKDDRVAGTNDQISRVGDRVSNKDSRIDFLARTFSYDISKLSQKIKNKYPRIPAFQTRAKCGVCGKSTTQSNKIVEGKHSRITDFPWIAQLAYKDALSVGPFCGASLISDCYLLTAAHCLEGETASNLLVRLGKTKALTNGNGYDVKMFKINPLYNGDDHDIAVIKLATTVTFTERIQPICLPSASDEFNNEKAFIAGWGSTNFNPQNFPAALKKAKVTVLEFKPCMEVSNYNNLNTFVICGVDDDSDTCQGDSGGPMMVQVNGGSYILVGITSYGIGCAKKKYPGVYTNVVQFVKNSDWIGRNTPNIKLCGRI